MPPENGGAAATTQAAHTDTLEQPPTNRSHRRVSLVSSYRAPGGRGGGDTMGIAALTLAQAGWAVFPCLPTGPHAKSPLTAHGHLDATRDPATITRWWRRWPPALIGARVPDGLAVVDIDPKNGGTVETLERVCGPLPATLTVWSGRQDGGCHLYFQHPGGELTASKLQGVDLKVRGYCIMPPSIHPATGQPYTWGEHQHPVGMPSRLVELLRPEMQHRVAFADRHSGNGRALVDFVAGFTTDGVNNALFWAACRAGENGVLDQIRDDLITTAVSVGESPRRAKKTVESARRTGGAA